MTADECRTTGTDEEPVDPSGEAEKVCLIRALVLIADHLDGIDAQIELARHAADQRIVEILTLPDPIGMADGGRIVAWAVTGEGQTHPVVEPKDDPRPRVVHRVPVFPRAAS